MDANWSRGPADQKQAQAEPYGRESGAGPESRSFAPGAAAPELPKTGSLPARLGESFSTNPVTGSAGLTIPLPRGGGRGGSPELAVTYDSSGRDGLFGYGWDLPLPSIRRRTDRGLPRYRDHDESDVFMLSDAEDLVPADAAPVARTVAGVDYRIRRYLPRIEGDFTRIERWNSSTDASDCKWRTITGDNVTTWFGEDAASRIADPADPERIYAWLVSSAHDDKGNAVAYEYAAENGVGVDTGRACEAGRGEGDRTAGRHLKRVRYGNTVPHYPVLDPTVPAPSPQDWLFTLVLDYGDHDPDAPTPEPSRAWPARPDPYSDRRPGFEVRTYRRCERALMFHHFPELGDEPTLVRSVDFTYDTEPVSGASRLVSASSTGYRRDGDRYERRSAPPLTPHYREPRIDPTVRDAPGEHPPAGLHQEDVLWVDLDGEGVSGVLSRRRGAWYYTRNRSPLHDETGTVEFSAPRPVTPRPSADTAAFLLDLRGTGRPELVRLSGPAPGFAARDESGAWHGREAFTALPAVDFAGAALSPADLTGDGLPDLVITDPAGTRWCEALGTEGFAPALPIDEPDDLRGPALVGVSATEAVQLADMTGDGLPDLVRIGNGTITYRPALGYGRFGPTVTMDHAPRFDRPDSFDPRRLLLADIDGNGRNDLVYLAADGVRLYANRGGDAWGEARALSGVPGSDNRRYVSVVDLRGTGTACLVWSTSLPGGTGAAMRYVDLMSAGRPHLLTGYENGTGGEVRIEYRPSTHFMLADERAGRPWPTALPFPVSCAHRVTRIDHVRETAFTSRTSYHDGHFDPVEREFRGFGRVETIDTEAYELLPAAADTGDADLHQPPVLTRTWYHTGAAAETGERLLHARRSQYFANTVRPEPELPEPALPAGLTDAEYREACRALKGVMLRSEVYGLDDTDESAVPYTVAETAYGIRMVQPRGDRRHGVFQLLPAEAIGYGYDRRPDDPRVSHSLVLEVDDKGRPLRSASVAYRRSADDPEAPETVRAAQARTHAAYAETDYTADIELDDARRERAPFEARSFELAGLPAGHLTAEQIHAAVAAAERVPYETVEADGTLAAPNGPVLRLTGRSQTLFRSDDLAGPLPLGEHGLLGLPHRSHRMVFTDGLIAAHYDGSVSGAELTDAGYEHRDGGWWAPSGTDLFAADAADHFYQPIGAVDPAGVTTTVERDEHDLAVVAVTNHIGQEVRFEHDYRLLTPWAAVDAAGNRTETAFDVLGAPVATALVGRPGETGMDSLADPAATATATAEYDLFAWRDHARPVWTKVRHRERHGPDNPAWQETYAYFDGSGTVVMSKGRAAPGPARRLDGTGTVVEAHADPRWVGNGRTVFNNKGLPVKQYEPYFSTTHEFESEAHLVQVGVTAIPRYDPLGRAFRVDHPDGTFARTETGPWKTVAHGPDDTVLDSAWFAERGSPDPAGPEPADPDERAAWLAAKNAGTPSITYLDSRGRTALTVADNGGGDLRFGRGEADATGGFTRVFDTRDRRIASGVADMAGGALFGDSAERGRRWALADVVGRMVRTWDEHGRSFRVEYDELHRPIAAFGSEPGGPERVLSRVVFGDSHPEAAERNLVGKPHMIFDSAGLGVVERCDGKGNALSGSRRFTADHATDPDWASLLGTDDPAELLDRAAPLLEPESEAAAFAASFDALGRIVNSVLFDGTEIEPVYDEANHLAELRARIGGEGPWQTFMTGQEYDAMGRRVRVGYGNGTTSTCDYDRLSRRLTELLTIADAAPGGPLQHLHYTYDAAGKIVEIGDDAQQTRFFAGTVAAPRQRFRYDALGQLVRAQGREHAGIPAGVPTGPGGPVGAALPHPNDTAAVRPYTEEFEYDDLGNLTRLRHMANGGSWNRRYRYAHDADPADLRNRLTETSVPADDANGPYSHRYHYDVYGNMISTPNLTALRWDIADQLREVNLGGGGTAHYGYSSAGRARKVIERDGGLRTERRYLGVVEIYREWMNGTLRLERRTVHLADEGGRFAQVDTKTADPGGIDDAPLNEPVVRYQYGNHLGSATLEADEDGAVISYEEYHPFGSTAYRAERPGTDSSLKRYRFHGKESDDETGLHYYGARYYASWLGRWISADPIGLQAGPNLYAYCSNDPVGRVDPAGTSDCDAIHGITSPGVDTVPELEDWARDAGVLYWGEPRYIESERRWEVDGHRHASPGEGGPIEAPPEASEDEPPPLGVSTAEPRDAPPPEPPPPPEPEPAPTPAGDGDVPATGSPGTSGAAVAQAGPVAERFIWNYRFPREGLPGTHRGRILETMMGVPWRDTTKGHDMVHADEVWQIKSTYAKKAGDVARKATRDAAASIEANPELAGKKPRAVIITQTDAPPQMGHDITTATQRTRGRKIPAGALDPTHVRGLPGRIGAIGRSLTGVGTALSGLALAGDLYHGDYAMAAGDALGTAGGALELWAIASPGAAVAGWSAMTVGIIVGGAGIAATSFVSGYRAYQAGDTAGVVAGAAGVVGGVALVAGGIALLAGAAAAPALLAVGAVLAIGAGVFHLGRAFDWW